MNSNSKYFSLFCLLAAFSYSVAYEQQQESDFVSMNPNPNPELKGRGEDVYNVPEVATELIDSCKKDVVKDGHPVVQLSNQLIDTLSTSLKTLKQAHDDFGISSRALSTLIRTFRTSVLVDLSPAITSLGDIRKFFLSKEHDAEVQRLKEFVDLCERLQALKKNGVLDAVADTILKLDGV